MFFIDIGTDLLCFHILVLNYSNKVKDTEKDRKRRKKGVNYGIQNFNTPYKPDKIKTRTQDHTTYTIYVHAQYKKKTRNRLSVGRPIRRIRVYIHTPHELKISDVA